MNKNEQLPKKIVFFTLVIIGLLVILFVLNQLGSKKEDVQTLSERPSIAGQPTIGNANAKVAVVEFGDYKCPACKAWDELYYPLLKRDYIDTGKISFTFVNAMFHGGESRLAAMAAEAVHAQDPQAFWTYHEEIFKAQPEDDHDAAWVTKDKLLQIAASHVAQIDQQQLLADIDNLTYLSLHEIDNALVEKFGVKQTPTIMVNGTKLTDPFDYVKLTEIIENQLDEG